MHQKPDEPPVPLAAFRCDACGHPMAADTCVRCQGSVRALDRAEAVQPRRGSAPVDVWRGLRDVHRAVFALLHGREFIGKLRVPVVANALCFAGLVLAGWFLLEPWFDRCFSGSWWVLEGLRAHRESDGPALWLLCCWLLLGPPLLDAVVGPLLEPLHTATELTMLGPPRAASAGTGFVLRLRDRARVLAAALVLLPFAMFTVLLPWIGLFVAFVLGAGIAAAVWFEPPMAQRGLDLRARLHLLWRNRWRALGVGAGVQFAAAVPFLNLLGLSCVAAIAATSAYLQFEKRRAA